jgi:hypothetical protein
MHSIRRRTYFGVFWRILAYFGIFWRTPAGCIHYHDARNYRGKVTAYLNQYGYRCTLSHFRTHVAQESVVFKELVHISHERLYYLSYKMLMLSWNTERDRERETFTHDLVHPNCDYDDKTSLNNTEHIQHIMLYRNLQSNNLGKLAVDVFKGLTSLTFM